MEFNLASAQMASLKGELEAWVQAYLQAGEWANPGLSSGLKLQPRWWRGPHEFPLSALQRACGPEPEMEYRMDAEAWAVRTARLAASFTTLERLPPLIAEYRQGVLSIRDGNHRLEAIRLKGWPTAWVLIWYNSIEDYQADSNLFLSPIL
jgi:hypothetical protein